jgi:hypothetical protein
MVYFMFVWYTQFVLVWYSFPVLAFLDLEKSGNPKLKPSTRRRSSGIGEDVRKCSAKGALAAWCSGCRLRQHNRRLRIRFSPGRVRF